jgi:hypothetical protein
LHQTVRKKQNVTFYLRANLKYKIKHLLQSTLESSVLRIFLKINQILINGSCERVKHFGSWLLDIFRERTKHRICRCSESFMVTTKTILRPCVRITTITAPTNISFQPHFMASVITTLKTLITNYTCIVFFTGLTFPGDVSTF